MLENLNEICHKGLSVRVDNKINKIADTEGLMMNQWLGKKEINCKILKCLER